MDKRRNFYYNAALKLATVNDKLIEDNAALTARVEELEEMLSDCLNYFKAEWDSVGSHPASRFADWVYEIEQAIEGDDNPPQDAL